MDEAGLTELLGPALAAALERKGYDSLTLVQQTVLQPECTGRDLRITSQTGSGKTLAVGFAIRHLVDQQAKGMHQGSARPHAIVIAPTRELAKQFEEELTWLFADLGTRLACVTGGASYRDEHRALARGPAVIVGTPGRLVDHLERKTIDTSEVAAVVLDEADRMLDLGFRDELEAILDKMPPERVTHLVSATFPREVRALADRVQRDPVHVQGTRLGVANVDIDHVLHVVDPRDRMGAIINLLLANPGEQTLVFARTRVDVGDIAEELSRTGFSVRPLSGEMQQAERTRALSAFRSGELRVLVATDVAARGIDVQDIARVIHAEPPTDADTYTHRSGRTGRAGRKGTSSVIVTPSSMMRTTRLLERARVTPRVEPIPSASDIRRDSDQRLFDALTTEETGEIDARTQALAERLSAADEGVRTRTLARLLSRLRQSGDVAEPRDLRDVRPLPSHRRDMPMGDRPPYPRSDDRPPPRDRIPAYDPRGQNGPDRRDDDRQSRPPKANEGWASFHVTWGEVHGADARRLMAIVCRRGGIRGSDVGAIRVGPTSSVVEVSAPLAEAFTAAASQPDARNPRILIRPYVAPADLAPQGPQGPPRMPRPEVKEGFKPRRPSPAPTSPRPRSGQEPPRRATPSGSRHR